MRQHQFNTLNASNMKPRSITGHKRHYNNINQYNTSNASNASSDTTSTKSTTSSQNVSPAIVEENNSFTAHLPPLNKKIKLNQSNATAHNTHNTNNMNNINNINNIQFNNLQPLQSQYNQLNYISNIMNATPIMQQPNIARVIPIQSIQQIECNQQQQSQPQLAVPISISDAITPRNNNLNLTNVNLDTLISAVSNLNNINANQIHLLTQLILATDQNRNNNNNNNNNAFSSQSRNIITKPQQIQTQTQTQIATVASINNNVSVANAPHVPIAFAPTNNRHTPNAYVQTTQNPLNPAGQSCHQCKTKKDTSILFYCTKTKPSICANKTKVVGGGFKKKKCRKKYCKSCMNKYYMDCDIVQLTKMKDCNKSNHADKYNQNQNQNHQIWKWICPSCIGICSCRACKRKRQTQQNQTISHSSNSCPSISNQQK